jgi:hypothetical protein
LLGSYGETSAPRSAMREQAVGSGIIRLVTREYAVGESAANRVFPDIAGYSRVTAFFRFLDREYHHEIIETREIEAGPS